MKRKFELIVFILIICVSYVFAGNAGDIDPILRQIAVDRDSKADSLINDSLLQKLEINEDNIIDLNLLASKLYHDEKFEDAVRIGEKCLNMIRAFQGIYNELYYHQLVNQATYLYALDRFPDCIVYESKAINIARKLNYPVSYERLQLMCETAHEIGAKVTPGTWSSSLSKIFDMCVYQPGFSPADVDKYHSYNRQFKELKEKGQEDTQKGIDLLDMLIPLSLSMGETQEAMDYTMIMGCHLIGENDTMSIQKMRCDWYYSMTLEQAYDKSVDIGEEINLFAVQDYASSILSSLNEMGKKDSELAVKTLMTRSYSYSHTGILETARKDAEAAAEMAKRLKGEDSELYNLALYYLMQVMVRYNYGVDAQIISTLKQVYRWQMEHLGVSHSETINTMLALGYFSSECGQYDEAQKYFTLFYDAQTEFIASCFDKMTPSQQSNFWSVYSYFYHEIIPTVNIKQVENSGEISCYSETAYASQLLSKGMRMYLQSKSKINVHALTLNWRDVQRNLKDGDIAVEFIYHNISEPQNTYYFDKEQIYGIRTYVEDSNVYAAAVITKTSDKPVFIKLFDTNEIGYLYFNEELRQQFLSEQLWEPILGLFPSAKRIYFSPVAELYNLPIESLPYYAGDGLMSDHFSMIRLTSTRELALSHKSNHNSEGLFFGGIDYDSETTLLGEQRGADADIPYLAGTEEEVLQISKVINTAKSSNAKATLFMHNKATEDVLKNYSFNKESILHIATHGFYYSLSDSEHSGSSLQRSGLLMAGATHNFFMSEYLSEANDGILTSEEISHLNLTGINLAVLSACETARGDITGDGVEGLQFGFKLAGVNSILMSLWKVDDEATCKLMTEFYSNWIAKKMTKHDALEAAKRTVRNTKGWENPRYWAAFVLLDGLD